LPVNRGPASCTRRPRDSRGGAARRPGAPARLAGPPEGYLRAAGGLLLPRPACAGQSRPGTARDHEAGGERAAERPGLAPVHAAARDGRHRRQVTLRPGAARLRVIGRWPTP